MVIPAFLGLVLAVVVGAAGEDEIDAAQRAFNNRITIPNVEHAPRIDGRIGSGEWDAAAMVTGFVSTKDSRLAGRQATVYLMYDKQRLYCAFRSVLPPAGALVANVRSRDGCVWNDDAIEILLAPEGVPVLKDNAPFQFVGNSLGVFADFKQGDLAWDGRWRYECVVENVVDDSGAWHDVWTAEVAVRFAELGVASPAEGEIWRINLCRDWQNPKEWTSWLRSKDFFDVSRYADLVFGGDAPIVKVASLGKPIWGRLELLAEVANPSTAGPANLLGEIALASGDGAPFEEKISINLKPGARLPLRFSHELRGGGDADSHGPGVRQIAEVFSGRHPPSAGQSREDFR